MNRLDAISMCGQTSPAFRNRPGDQRHPCTLHPGHRETVHVHRDPLTGKVTARWTNPIDLKLAARSW